MFTCFPQQETVRQRAELRQLAGTGTSEFHHLPKLHGFVGDPLCQQSFATASGRIDRIGSMIHGRKQKGRRGRPTSLDNVKSIEIM